MVFCVTFLDMYIKQFVPLKHFRKVYIFTLSTFLLCNSICKMFVTHNLFTADALLKMNHIHL